MNPRNTQSTPAVRLRLVGVDDDVRLIPMRKVDNSAAREVARENHAAAHSPAREMQDPRLLLAQAASGQLEGAVLRPERRDHLLKLANKLGVQSFEANLVIAMAQDAARRGRSGVDARAVTSLPRPQAARKPDDWRLWAAASLLGGLLASALVWWIISGG